MICIIIQALNNPICIHKKSLQENSLNSDKKVIIMNCPDWNRPFRVGLEKLETFNSPVVYHVSLQHFHFGNFIIV